MRFPFDLIAAVLCVDGISSALLMNSTAMPSPLPWTTHAGAWLGFIVVVWLLNDWVTRRTEWRLRKGVAAALEAGKRHPLEIHTWSLRAVQALSVVLFAGVLWLLEWPVRMRAWPEWLGYGPHAKLGHLRLSESALAALVLNVAPFLAAMVASWLPRRRLSSGLRGRVVTLRSFLAYEIKLTWLPLLLWIIVFLIRDGVHVLPPRYTDWLSEPSVDLVVSLACLGFLALLALPLLMVKLWDCRPLPDGFIKDRLTALIERSGVKARAILIWGPRQSGLLNACVLGPWSRFRYVLISPALVDELTLEETEAVIAHELGHARYGHLTLLFVMVLCLSAMVIPLHDALLKIVPLTWAQSPIFQAVAIFAFIGAYMFFFFGAVMRQCEREADLASAELMGTPQPLISALEKLAMITGNIRSLYCWHHGSIATRVAAVEALSRDAEQSRRFHARLRRLRWLVVMLTVAAMIAQFAVRTAPPADTQNIQTSAASLSR